MVATLTPERRGTFMDRGAFAEWILGAALCTTLALLVLTAVHGSLGAFLLAVAVPGVVVAVIDARTGRIPTALVVVMTIPSGFVLLETLLAHRGATPDLAVSMLIGAAWFAGPLFVLHLIAPDSMGFGDVKLAVALGLTIGVVDGSLALIALCVASGSSALCGLVARRPTLPFGPGLMFGWLVVALSASTSGWEHFV